MSGTAPETARRPWEPEELLDYLSGLGIESATFAHAPVLTVAEAKVATASVDGCHCKNLFLEERGAGTWLVVMREDKPLDLKELAETLGGRRLSFASRDKLREKLGVFSGAVTPFAVVNDPDVKVRVVLDAELLSRPALKFHPLVNDRTTVISPDGLQRFLAAQNHPPRVVGL